MMEFLATCWALIKVLGIVVVIHELGHFLAAKAFGVRVEVFSLGFGPRLFGVRWGDTDYRLSPIPLGGYVRMAGELPGEATERGSAEGGVDHGLLNSKPRWQRLIVMFAGPAANAVLAIGLWWGLFMHGSYVEESPSGPPVVESCEPGSPAEKAGLHAGDRIRAIDGKPLESADDYQQRIWFMPGQMLSYEIERDGTAQDLAVKVVAHPQYGVGWDGVRLQDSVVVQQVVAGKPAEKAGMLVGDRLLEINGHVPASVSSAVQLLKQSDRPTASITVLRGGNKVALELAPEIGTDGKPLIGVALGAPTRFVSLPPGEALQQAFRNAAHDATLLFRTIGALLRRQVGLDVMSGPLEIARISKEQLDQGLTRMFWLVAFISLQLGLFNLLPVPVLDGGHIVILLFEGLIRRDLSPLVKERVLQVGLVLLLVFGVAVMYNDLRKWGERNDAPAPASAPAPSPSGH